MKNLQTFKKFIREGVEPVKTFGDLEKGDKFYYWKRNMNNIAEEFTFLWRRPSGWSKGIDVINYDYGLQNWISLSEENLNTTCSLTKSDRDPNDDRCIATSFEELQDKVMKECGVRITDIKERKPRKR